MDTTTTNDAVLAGLEALDRGEPELARACLEHSESRSDRESAGLYWVLKGAVAAEDGDLEQARACFRRGMELSPDDPSIARRVADVLTEFGLLPEALALLGRLAEQRPGDVSLLVSLAYLRIASGDPHGARQTLERAAMDKPHDPVLRRALADVCLATGDLARGADLLAEIVRDAPAPTLLGRLAAACLQLERYGAAEKAFRTLARTDPDHALVAQHGRTWCRIKKRDWRGALGVALEATRMDRYDLTTSLLAYARDRLFGNPPDAAGREAELETRFLAELNEHAELHQDLVLAGTSETEGEHGV